MVAQTRQGNCETSSRLRWRTTYLVPPPGPFQVPVRGRRLQFAACGQSATPISHRRLALFGGWASSRSEQGLHELLCRRGGGSRRPLSSRWRRKDPAPPFKLNGRRAPDPPTNRAESCARTCMKKQPLCSSLSFVGRRLLLTVLGCRRTDRQTGCHFLTPSLLVLPVSRHCVHCGGSGRGGSPQVGTDDQVPGIAAETVPLVRLDWGEGLAARRHASCNSWLLCSGGVPCGRCTVSGYLGVRGPPQPYFAAKSPWDRPPRQGGCACARGTVPPCGSRPPPRRTPVGLCHPVGPPAAGRRSSPQPVALHGPARDALLPGALGTVQHRAAPARARAAACPAWGWIGFEDGPLSPPVPCLHRTK